MKGRRLGRLAVAVWISLGSFLAVGQEEVDGSFLGSEGIPFERQVPAVDLDLQNHAYWLAGSAKRALGSGLYDLAYALATRSKELAAGETLDLENELVIVDSLLARSDWIEAGAGLRALAELEGVPMERVRLREAMIDYAEGDVEKVKRQLEGLALESFSAGDSAWLLFLQGWTRLPERRGGDQARELFDAARSEAMKASPDLVAQIDYLVFRSLLETRTASARTIPQLQSAILENAGKEVRYLYAQQLAVLYYDSGNDEAAIELIVDSLETIPEGLSREKAQFQLLATMAAGMDRIEGRQALSELIAADQYPDLMSVALQQAFSRARFGDDAGAEVIRMILDQMIQRPIDHALLDQALYYRAVFRFLDGDYVGAEEDAAQLQRRFPASPYRRGMLALQASCAWNRERFRTAASRLQQMRSEFSDLQRDFRLSALIADCYLRAGERSNTREDYRNAAEAYATSLANVTTVSQGGPLFFQLVYARLGAGQLDLALEAIDNPELRRLAGGEKIWQAQWMALREMRRVGRTFDAYDRVQEALLEESSNPYLKLRLLWLAARLSAVSGEPEYTIDWVGEIEDFVASDELADADQDLLNKVLASSLLSLSEAHIALGEPEEAVAIWERLRADYAGYEAALFSYIAQARYLSLQNRTVEAQQLLVSLADQYKDHRLAPVALFEAALNAERRGQDTYLDEATKLLQRIANDYPESEVVYRARLMQADLLRRLNKFGSAERIYLFLENEYAERPDRFLAQMSLADTLLAQADEDPRKFDAAISRLELIMDLPASFEEVSPDLRIEAGYKLGQAWRSRGEALKGKQVFWILYDQTLVEQLGVQKLTRKGRYWLSRCLFALAEITADEGEIDQAIHFYEQVIEHGLNGVELARDRLEILTAPAPRAVAVGANPLVSP